MTADGSEQPGVRSRRGIRLLAAAAAGALLALAFPPYSLAGGWLAVPAFAGGIATFRGLSARAGAVQGLVLGLVFFLGLLRWLQVLGPDAWIALSLLCAAFWAAAGAAIPALLRRPGWVLTVPLLWVLVEAARARVPWGGFPWGRLAFSQPDTPLVGWASLGGPALVTLAVALLATALLALVDAARASRSAGVARWAALGAVVVLIGAVAGSVDWTGPVSTSQPIAVVQGNVPRLGLDFNAQRRAVLDGHVAATEALAESVAAGEAPQPVAVIWPENSSDIDPLRNADAAAQIDAAASAIGAPILVGAVMVNPDDPTTDDPTTDDHVGTILNVGLVWDPVDGPGQSYVKRHPVPFGEYLPLRDLLTRFITRFERIPQDFAAGTEPGLLQIGPVRAGVVICFEVAYDELVRDAVLAGGQTLVVQTNNATYGKTGMPEQQLAITRVQAVASGRTTLVAATSGISAVISPDGSLDWTAPEFTRASTVVEVPMRTGLTPAMRIGGALDWVALATLLVLLAVPGWRRAGRPSGSAGPHRGTMST